MERIGDPGKNHKTSSSWVGDTNQLFCFLILWFIEKKLQGKSYLFLDLIFNPLIEDFNPTKMQQISSQQPSQHFIKTIAPESPFFFFQNKNKLNFDR